MLARAGERAAASDRHDVADYINLKASNDLIRQTGVAWLFETLTEFAAAANRSGIAISIERTEPSSFSYRGANIVGSSVKFRHGLRCLTVEAGWTRTPADGFMRGGGLAFARLRHFGLPKANVDLGLFGSDAAPVWRTLREDGTGNDVHSNDLHGHIKLLTDA